MARLYQERAIFPELGHGLSLRTPHFTYVLEQRPKVDWFEVHSEEFMGILDGQGGKPIHVLRKVRDLYPIALHGLSMGLGNSEPIDKDYIRRLKRLIDIIEPCHVSDHLAWNLINGQNLYSLLPVPYTEEMLTHLVFRVLEVQELLGRRILIENISAYMTFRKGDFGEAEFIRELTKRADCGLLLDINSLYVNSTNNRRDPTSYLDQIPPERIGFYHVSGHSIVNGRLIDTHSEPVTSGVWGLYQRVVERFGSRSLVLERDESIPHFLDSEKELLFVKMIEERGLDDRKRQTRSSEESPGVDRLENHPESKKRTTSKLS